MPQSLPAQLRTLRQLAERMHRNERDGARVPHGVYRRDALRLQRVLAQCPATALGIELTDLPPVWEALENRYFAEHGHFAGRPAVAVAAQALIRRAAGTTAANAAVSPTIMHLRSDPPPSA